jgi:hypothetical protein
MVSKRRRVGGPFVDVILERVAVESEEVSPVSNLFGAYVEAGGESGGLGGVVGVNLELFFFRQLEEFSSDLHHVGYGGFVYPVVFNPEEAVIAARSTDLVDYMITIATEKMVEVDERDGFVNNMFEIGTLVDRTDVV